MNKVLCIYHGNCADGFGAAWVARRYYGADNIEFHAGVYQNPPPVVDGREVVILDFSYKRDVMRSICERASYVRMIDHHKSAIEDLAGFTAINFEAFFDIDHSGAMLTWLTMFGSAPAPQLLKHIEDRDLWRFDLPFTREIQASVFSYPYDFAVWDELMVRPISELITEGTAIERKHHKDIAELVGVTQRTLVIGGHTVPVANLPYTLTSDAGHLMAQGRPFAACYWDTPAGRVFSLRSTDDGMDVADIAKQYGGGGHAHASGFRVPYGHELTL